MYKANLNNDIRALFMDGKVLAQLNNNREETNTIGERLYWKGIIARGLGNSGFSIMKGIWIYRPEEKAMYVHLENDEHPSKHNWSVFRQYTGGVEISRAKDVTLRGLDLRGGYRGILIHNDSSSCKVLDCKISGWDGSGIVLQTGASKCLIEGNEITRNSYEDFNDSNRSEVWAFHKNAGLYDRVGIYITGGIGNKVLKNNVYQTFDGIDVLTSDHMSMEPQIKNPNQNRDTEIAYNTIDTVMDSGMEVGGPVINVSIHNNTINNALSGLRYKTPRYGPVFIYRNVIKDSKPHSMWYSLDDTNAEGYVYHNTIIGNGYALRFGWDDIRASGAQNFHYLNNLFLTPNGFFQTPNQTHLPQFICDYNVATGGGQPYPDNPDRDSHSRYVESVEMNAKNPLVPSSTSPAIDAGLDLSTYLHGYPLPGCKPHYFKGLAPDAGAFEVK